jgi:hypothetical protein
MESIFKIISIWPIEGMILLIFLLLVALCSIYVIFSDWLTWKKLFKKKWNI